jgi:excinuclease ABC subunit C
MDIKEKIKTLPESCGVYIMKSKAGQILYIGKATSIRKRVTSHFSRSGSFRDSLFIDKVADIDFILCDTEEQALILEATLVKEKQPKYNIELKDDKSYPYVVITQEPFPRIYIARITKGEKERGVKVFGPFTRVKLLKKALNLVRRIFPFCTCKKPRKSCLYRHLKLCPGPGIDDITPSDYRENIDSIIKILRGERKSLIEKLQSQMARLSKEERFEEAASIRDKLIAIQALYSGKREAEELLILKDLLNLEKIPFRIEAIDISSLYGGQACGSVVVFKDGLPDKSNYRRYRIKEVEGIDDYKMIAEVTKRRYKRLLEEKKHLPDLVIVDGGLAHARSAKKELEKLKLKIKVVGIAKRNEEIFFPDKENPLIIPRDSPALHLLQRLRDEAHRFAHKYHTLLRKKKAGLG